MRWEEIVQQEKGNRPQMAVGTTTYHWKGKDVKVDVIKPRYGDGRIVLHNSGIPIGRANADLVDSITDWRPYYS